MAARFEVHEAVHLGDRYLFGLMGVIEEGMVHTGMEASLEVEESDDPDGASAILGRVHGVEFHEKEGVTEPTLTFHYRDPEKLKRWESIDWSGRKIRLEWTA